MEFLHLNLDEKQQESIGGMTREYPYVLHESNFDIFEVPWHWHEEVEVNYVESGAIGVITTNGSYRTNAGEAFFMNSNVMNCKKKAEGAGHTHTYEHLFHPALLSGYFQSVYETKYMDPVLKDRQIELVPFLRSTKEGSQAIQKVIALIRLQEKKHVEFETRNLLSEIWVLLLKNIEKNGVERADVNLQSQSRIRFMMTYIHQHYAEKISLADVAASADISERECLRTFRKNLDRTPFDYLIEYRLDQARKMLHDPDRSVTEIALAVGFSGAAYFGKLFREHYGMTPGAYRKM